MKLVDSIRTSHAQVLMIRSLRSSSSFLSLQVNLTFYAVFNFFVTFHTFFIVVILQSADKRIGFGRSCQHSVLVQTFSGQYFSDSIQLFLLTGHTQHVTIINFVDISSIIDQMLYDCTLMERAKKITLTRWKKRSHL